MISLSRVAPCTVPTLPPVERGTPLWGQSWQCTPNQRLLPQGCHPALVDVALDAITLPLGCSFPDQESQLQRYACTRTSCSSYCNLGATVPSVSWYLHSCTVVAALPRNGWEVGMQGHIPVALLVKRGAR